MAIRKISMKPQKALVFLIITLLIILLAATAFAAEPKPLSQTIKDVFEAIMKIIYYIFSLEFLGFGEAQQVSAFIRLCLWLFTFVLFYELLKKSVMKSSPKPALIIAITLAFLATFSMTPETLLTIGGIFGFFIAFLLIIIPILIVASVTYILPSNNRYALFVKIICILVAIWMFSLAQPLFTGEIRAVIGPY